jgi:TetR/AcrR family transcriptional repressor of nem operon
MLTKKTGLGKQSIYNAYGDKKELLKKSLACYGMSPDFIKSLGGANGRKKIEAIFAIALAEAADPTHPGCLVTNILMEKGASDREVAEAASARWQHAREIMQKIVEEGMKDGSIRRQMDAEMLSYSLMNVINGIRVTARATEGCQQLKKVVAASLDSLL